MNAPDSRSTRGRGSTGRDRAMRSADEEGIDLYTTHLSGNQMRPFMQRKSNFNTLFTHVKPETFYDNVKKFFEKNKT
jgi:hypothetical protein